MSALSHRSHAQVMIISSPGRTSDTTSYGIASPAQSFDSNLTEMHRAGRSPERIISPYSIHSGGSGYSSRSDRYVSSATASTASPTDCIPIKSLEPASDPCKSRNIDQSSTDIDRERAAGAKALALLDEALTQESTDRQRSSVPASTRKAAARRKAAILMHKSVKKGVDPKAPQESAARRLMATRPMEQMAQTTRKVKIISAEDEFETIADFKCQMFVEREQEATKKALRMLNRQIVKNVC